MTIETVDVGWCIEITDQGATQIAQSSKSLRYLGLMRCDKVRSSYVKHYNSYYVLFLPHTAFICNKVIVKEKANAHCNAQ